MRLWVMHNFVSQCCIGHYLGSYDVNMYGSTSWQLFHQTSKFARKMHLKASTGIESQLFWKKKMGRWGCGSQNGALSIHMTFWMEDYGLCFSEGCGYQLDLSIAHCPVL